MLLRLVAQQLRLVAQQLRAQPEEAQPSPREPRGAVEAQARGHEALAGIMLERLLLPRVSLAACR